MSSLSPSLPFVHPALEWAHPVVQEWFVSRFGTPTEPQEQGWPHILAGRTTLIAAPTGSGKTLAAFLACIDRLVRKALAGELQDRTEVLYVSPLKALGNDIQKNLEVPLSEITELAGRRGLLMPDIRTAVRTGDTLMHERRAMLKRPPHILVTTPESLYILLTAEKSRAVLKDVETVIVDEIHAVAGDKRGAHLALSLERLDALVSPRAHQVRQGLHVVEKTRKLPVRIGLSATQKPISTIADFLTGTARTKPAVVDVGHRRELDLQIEVPASELGPVASNEMWGEIYDRIAEFARQHRSTLVFVNTRRLAERVAHHLGERLGEEAVAAHHGSLSRKLRLAAEHKLKSGEIRILVATASLQLGIDIGFVDLVCQIGSPRAINVALQRIGRAGHWRGAIAKGRVFATTRDELLECAALVRAIRQGDLDRILVPEAPLDVLAQQIVAACSAEDWKEDDLFALARRAYSYRELTREDFGAIIVMLSDGIAARRGRFGAFLHRDRVNGIVRGRRGSRLAAIMSGGAIPDTALYQVVAEPEGVPVGTVDEDFAVESLAGDIFLLGNSSWRIRRVEGRSGRILVEDAHGAPPNIPFWRGEAPARTAELSSYVAEIREQVSALTPNVTPTTCHSEQSEESAVERSEGPAVQVSAALSWLQRECGLDESGAEQALEYIVAGRAVLGAVPSQQTIIAERFFDEGGGMQLVIHAPFGGRVNRAWGLALRKRFCRSFNFELQAAATEDGLNISLAEQHSFSLADVFHFLQPETVQPVLEQAALASPIFGTRFRWDATRALALLRFRGGNKIPPQVQRMLSDDLLAAVFPDVAACQENISGDIQIPAHPLVKEVMKDVLTEAMDLDGLRAVLRGIEAGSIRTLAVDTPVPSQFSHEILNANPYAYLDDAPLEERRARAVQLRRTLPESVLEEVGKLDPAAIAQVREEAWPDVRDPDELHDALLTLVFLPESCGTAAPGCAAETQGFGPASQVVVSSEGASAPGWRDFFDQLTSARRAGVATVTQPPSAVRSWVAAERARSFRVLYPDADFETPLPEVEPAAPSREEALLALVTGWMQHLGPTTASALSAQLALPASEIEQALLRLEAAGSILRGKFTGATDELEWCDRRLLARIHRLTVGRLRREIEPVTSAQFMRWLLRWQHVAVGTQVRGERGTLETLQQLQGFEIPANAWERQVLARRIADYDPKFLDQLCLTGAVGWGRLSPHPVTLDDSAHGRRVVPTSVAPITFFVREESDWMLPHDPAGADELHLTDGARQVREFLQRYGASFFADIVRGTARLKSEVETALWELVAAGLVTADGFDNLRALVDPKRRAGQGHGRLTRPRHSAGRWSLLYAGEGAERGRAVEATCWMLLRRYGVVFRELLARETILPKWRELLIGFRRLEDRGEVRGGRFLSGFIGEQFGLPLAVESLRALRKQEPTGELITLSAADPLNLVGIVVPGERVPAISGNVVRYRDGIPIEIEESPLRLAAS